MTNPTPPAQRRFLKLTDVAEELNISQDQAYALVRSGELPAIQIGGRGQWRVGADVFEAYIAEATAGPKRWSPAACPKKRRTTTSSSPPNLPASTGINSLLARGKSGRPTPGLASRALNTRHPAARASPAPGPRGPGRRIRRPRARPCLRE
ncbi:helix-turn-helix domain-containing protein [Crystallibacter crystallopoietes]|uniref:helix-turn-helix domain-containing protein n=1 Tax=Crystallibacter crystallopoietes TaxID=37928 RepID=UPI0009DAFA4E